MMKFVKIITDFQINWVDLAFLALIVVGICQGRKRGMSEELLQLVKWVTVVVTAGLTYKMGSDPLVKMFPLFSRTSWDVSIYLAIVCTVLLIFHGIKNSIGDRLIGTDVFGRMEYPLGMGAGAIRFVCIALTCMAVINARQYTVQEVKSREKFQADNYGDIRFPTFMGVQQSCMKESFVGRQIKERAKWILIEPSVPNGRELRNGDADARLNSILDKK